MPGSKADRERLARSGEHTPDPRVLGPRVSEALSPPLQMMRSSEPPVDRAACPVALVVPADVVSEQVVREEKVAGASADLRRLGELDVRIACGLCESSRASSGEEVGMTPMRPGPDPEVAAIVRRLIVEEEGREKRERARNRLAGLVAVDVRPIWSVVERRNVQRNLGLVKREFDAAVPNQVSSELQDASWPLEHIEERR